MCSVKFEASEVDRLEKAYWPVQSERLQRIEHDLENRAPRIRAAQHLTKEDFLLVSSWVAPRSKPRHESNAEEVVQMITERAFRASDDASRLEILTELRSIGYAAASTILHFFHQDSYPILTKPSLWSLGVENEPYTIDFWLDYTDFFRRLISKWNMRPRIIDRALWQYHHENKP